MDIKKLFEDIKNAKEEPTETCSDGGEHQFRSITHLDGRDSFTWIYKCEKCEEVVKKETKRTGSDKAYWC